METAREWFSRAVCHGAEEEQMLTEYDLHRQPLPLVHPHEERTLILRKLNQVQQELTCSICLCVINTCSVVRHCMHRFCYECITKYLRVGKKQCPTCRTKCSNQRQLRPDTRFDKLIALMYPDLEKHEKEQEKMIEEINNSIDVDYQRQVQEMMERQQKLLEEQVKLEKELNVEDPYQVVITRPVGRPPKRGVGRPPKRGRGRPPKHPRPSNALNEAQLKMLCQARLDVYHHLHIDKNRLPEPRPVAEVPSVRTHTPTRITSNFNTKQGLILLNLFEKGNPNVSVVMLAAPRVGTLKQIEPLAKNRLKAKKLLFFQNNNDSKPLQDSFCFQNLSETKIFFQKAR